MKNYSLWVQRINVMSRKTVMSLLTSRPPSPTHRPIRGSVQWAGGTLLSPRILFKQSAALNALSVNGI